jgi:hypothetical protein
MTMLLLSIVRFPVTPVSKRPGWFQIAGRAVPTCECEVLAYLEALVYKEGDHIIPDAKLVGIHDNEAITNDDPRFNYEMEPGAENDEPDFAVAEYTDEQGVVKYQAAMLINEPERILLEFARDTLDAPQDAEPFPEWKAGSREAMEAEYARRRAGKPHKTTLRGPKSKPSAKEVAQGLLSDEQRAATVKLFHAFEALSAAGGPAGKALRADFEQAFDEVKVALGAVDTVPGVILDKAIAKKAGKAASKANAKH